MHEFKKELKSTNLSYSMLDFLASKTDFVIEEIPGRERAWAVGETNLRLDQPNRDGNCNQVQRDMLRTASWCWPRSVWGLFSVQGSLVLLCYLRDSFSLDSENNAVRKFVFKDLTNRIKMTATLKTLGIYWLSFTLVDIFWESKHLFVWYSHNCKNLFVESKTNSPQRSCVKDLCLLVAPETLCHLILFNLSAQKS